MHGEDPDDDAKHLIPVETPPRAWGRLGPKALDYYNLRNTPTCMGKTIEYQHAHDQ